MKHITAPFTGQLIEMPDRADRILFWRTVIELTREGEFEPTTRVLPHGDYLLVNLSEAQIEEVRAALHAQEAEPPSLPEPEPVRSAGTARRPRIAEATRETIMRMLMDGAPVKTVSEATGIPYQSVYYYLPKARRAKQAGRA